MLTPRNYRVSLPDNIYELLVYYYNDAYYDLEFVTIAGASNKLILEEESEDFIVVLPNITQYRRYHTRLLTLSLVRFILYVSATRSQDVNWNPEPSSLTFL